jgi:phage portal protein BeeE
MTKPRAKPKPSKARAAKTEPDRRFVGDRFGGPVTIRSFQAWAKERPSVMHGGSPFTSQTLEHPFRQVGWVYACIREITRALRMGVLRFRVDQDPDSPNVPDSHPVAQLFARPYPGVNPRNLSNAFAQYLNLDGEALIVGLDASGRPARTYGVGPDALLELPERLFVFRGGEERLELDRENGTPATWRILTGSGFRELPVAATALVREDDPDRPFRGVGPMRAAWGAAEAMYLANLVNVKIAERGGEKEGYVEIGEQIGADEFERVQEQIAEGWDRAKERGRTRILTNGAKYVPTGAAARDLAYPQLLGLSKKDISAVFGVADALLGEGASNYATFHGERRRFWETTILPTQELIAQTIREWIERLRDTRLRNCWPYYDVSGVRALREDLATVAQSIQLFQGIGIPLAKAIEVSGLKGLDAKEIPGSDVPLIRVGLQRLEDVVAGGAAGAGLDDEQSEETSPGSEDEAQGDEAPPASGEEATDGEEADDDGEEDAPAAEKALRAATPTDSSARELRDWYEASEKRRQAGDVAIARAVRRVWREARRDQLAHLAKLAGEAESAPQPRATALYETRGHPDDALLDRLARAWDEDRATREAVRAADADDPRLWSVVRSCTGEQLFRVEREIVDARKAALGDADVEELGGLQRLQDLVLLRALDLTEAEIDQLLVLQAKKYAEEMAEKLGAVYLEVFEDTLQALAKETGLATIATVSPAKLAALKSQGVKLANDVQGTLSRRVRSALIRTLAEHPEATGSIRERVRAVLGPLEDATRDQFNKADRRALTIARTETVFVDGNATYEQHVAWYEEGKLISHEWVAREPAEPAGRTRASHAQLHATKVRVGEPWTSPVSGALLFYPGDKSSDVPGEFINCRCGLKPRRLARDLDEGVITQDEFDALTGA